jgi:exodeoxyribonuclease VII small subunit
MSAKKDKEAPIAEMGYAQALADLEAILAELEADDSDLDRLAERVRRASELVRHCREKILATQMEVEKVLKDLPEAAEAEGGEGIKGPPGS